MQKDNQQFQGKLACLLNAIKYSCMANGQLHTYNNVNIIMLRYSTCIMIPLPDIDLSHAQLQSVELLLAF